MIPFSATTFRRARLPGLAWPLFAAMVVLSSSPARAQWCTDIQGGWTFTEDSPVTASRAFPEPAFNVERRIHFENSAALGVGVEHFGKPTAWLGWAVETYSNRADGGSAQGRVTHLSALAVARRAHAVANAVPGRSIDPFAALGFDMAGYDVATDFRPEAPEPLSHTAFGGGFAVEAGAAWYLGRHFGVVPQYRFTVVRIDRSVGDLEGVLLTMRSHQALVGLRWRF